MSISSRYSPAEIAGLTKEEFMREATFSEMITDYGRVFNVAFLARESTKHEDQIKALAIQVQQLEEFCNRPNFCLKEYHKFVEEGKSGLVTERRSTFQAMIKIAEKREFDILVVDALSRFSRNAKDALSVVETFKEYGVGILVLKGQYWTYNMNSSDLLRLILEAGFAQAESMQTSERVRSHMETIVKNGQLLGGNMFGYRLQQAVNRKDNTLAIEPVEAYTVRTIFEKYASDNPEEELSTSGLVPYLIENNMRTFDKDLNWTPSKIRRILMNEKYMGYQMHGKSKIVDAVKKKKVLTHIQPIREDVLDEEGNVIQKCNLVRGNWEPIVSEELWWKAHNKRISRSMVCTDKAVKKGIRLTNDMYARKAFCSCGYSLSPQYTHVAKGNKSAQMRYKCRWQVNKAVQMRNNELQATLGVCSNSAVSEMKIWLASKYVFSYLFDSGKDAVLKTLLLIEQCRQNEVVNFNGETIESLEQGIEKLKRRKSEYINMRADKEITVEEYRQLSDKTENEIQEIEEKIDKIRLESATAQKRLFDMDTIRQRLNTYVDVDGVKVCEEMIDTFVERIIYRGNDEFLWIINLSGSAVGSEGKYRIPKYDEEYSDFLKSDKEFDIVAQFIIPLEECRKYCEGVVGRRFVPRYWKPMVIKIAIC